MCSKPIKHFCNLNQFLQFLRMLFQIYFLFSGFFVYCSNQTKDVRIPLLIFDFKIIKKDSFSENKISAHRTSKNSSTGSVDHTIPVIPRVILLCDINFFCPFKYSFSLHNCFFTKISSHLIDSRSYLHHDISHYW